MWGFRHGMMGYGWGGFMMVCLAALIILGIFVFVRYLQSPERPAIRAADGNALNILNERYVKGEISEEEYRKKKEDIR